MLSWSGVGGLSARSSWKTLLHAYRSLSKLVHPDRCQLEGAKEAFQLLSEAKEELLHGAVEETPDEREERSKHEDDTRKM